MIDTLREGPLDIVGDLHGEVTALEMLMSKLGYDHDGHHAQGRHLVFVGDLVDRGEDSPAIVGRVAELVEQGQAQCILGNHEINLLLDSRKEGNGWFYPEDQDHDIANGHFIDAPRPDPGQRSAILDWLGSLPLALEREDLRVVHACWHPPAISALRNETRSIQETHEAWSRKIEAECANEGLNISAAAEMACWAQALTDPNTVVPFLSATAAIESRKQTDHPIKSVTSGLEQPTSAPFFSGGKWRMNERVAWWNEYRDEPAVIFGHYWRWAGDEADATARSRGPNLFQGYSAWDWLGPKRNAMCVDYCAGLRWRERNARITPHRGVAGAVQWPERNVVVAG